MEKRIPKTKEECFAQLDEMLSEEDKKTLMEDDALSKYHFTLGLWIRNNWIYPLNKEQEKNFLKMIDEISVSPYGNLLVDPDMVSSVIIEKYVEYLKSNKLTK